MGRWRIPEPIGVDWAARTVDSAKITVSTLDDGRFRQVIEHAPLPGVTPAMCLWYLQYVDQTVRWRGHAALAYRLWHPRDHIFFRRLGQFGPGDRWHIVEAFGADRRYLVDEVFHVTKLDETGFTMEVRRLRTAVLVADERWQPATTGLRWTVEMTAGTAQPGLRAISDRIIRRRLAFLSRWRRHNVEEVGNLANFLPDLYQREAAELPLGIVTP